jgi:hypothetical protein
MPGVPGRSGPVPKRSQERMGHRSKAEKGLVDKVTVGGRKVKIPPANPKWHAVAKGWYESLPESGQSIFFEPSDWASAYFVAEIITDVLDTGGAHVPSGLFSAAWTAMNDLLSSEGARRRLRLELERESIKGQSRSTIAIADYQAKLAA